MKSILVGLGAFGLGFGFRGMYDDSLKAYVSKRRDKMLKEVKFIKDELPDKVISGMDAEYIRDDINSLFTMIHDNYKTFLEGSLYGRDLDRIDAEWKQLKNDVDSMIRIVKADEHLENEEFEKFIKTWAPKFTVDLENFEDDFEDDFEQDFFEEEENDVSDEGNDIVDISEKDDEILDTSTDTDSDETNEFLTTDSNNEVVIEDVRDRVVILNERLTNEVSGKYPHDFIKQLVRLNEQPVDITSFSENNLKPFMKMIGGDYLSKIVPYNNKSLSNMVTNYRKNSPVLGDDVLVMLLNSIAVRYITNTAPEYTENPLIGMHVDKVKLLLLTDDEQSKLAELVQDKDVSDELDTLFGKLVSAPDNKEYHTVLDSIKTMIANDGMIPH